MERKRNEKLLAILALCIAVVGLTLGFAAFSNTLTISSSATVTPNSSDFNLTLYGIPEIGEYDQAQAVSTDYRLALVNSESQYTSKTTSVPIMFYHKSVTSKEVAPGKPAVINNTVKGSISVSDISATFVDPAQGAEYYFVLKNEGNYDAYITNQITEPQKTCTPGEDATPELVAKACEKIYFTPKSMGIDENGQLTEDFSDYFDDNGNMKIPAGRSMFFSIDIRYEDGSTVQARADGPFTVKWTDWTINFSTAAPAQ